MTEKERPFIFGTNTKMYKTSKEISTYLQHLSTLVEDTSSYTLLVLPPHVALKDAVASTTSPNITIGAQNIAPEAAPQNTGEISPDMLQELGVSLAMVGHSERRTQYGESNFLIQQRLDCAIESGMKVLLCVGESAMDKEYGIQREALSIQLKIALKNIDRETASSRLIVAYEPTWAIGAQGIPADATYVNEIQGAIRQTLLQQFGDETGEAIPILYGGSVNPQNAVQLGVQPHVDGLYIGRSALDADCFYQIIKDVMGARERLA